MSSAGEVEVEWGSTRFRAVVNDYGVAVITGAAIVEVQNEGEKAMAHENEQEQFSADVGHFVQRLITRQDDFEAKARKRQDEFEAEIRKKLDALDQVVKTALEESLRTIESLIDKRMRRPPAGQASSN